MSSAERRGPISTGVKLTMLLFLVSSQLLLGYYYYHGMVGDLERLELARNADLAKVLNNALFPVMQPLLTRPVDKQRHELTEHPALKEFRVALKPKLEGLNVVKVKLYDMQGLTVFSTQSEQIGEDQSGNAGFLYALSGKKQASVVQRNNYNVYDQLIEEVSLVQTYLPIRESNSGDILGVFELYTNAEHLMHLIHEAEEMVIGVLLLMLGSVLSVFALVFQRIDRFGAKTEAEWALTQADSELIPAAALEKRVLERTQQLRASNTWLEQVLDCIRDPIMVIDLDLHVKSMNQAAREINPEHNRSEPIFCYKVSHHRQIPCSGEDHPCPMHQVLATEKPFNTVHTHYLPTGEVRRVEVMASPLWRDSKIVGLVETTHDITAIEQVAAELQAAKEVAEGAVAAKTQFLANMSHELRTPLNAVIGMADVLQRTPLSTQQHQYVEILSSSSQALLNIINDILNLSKLEFGKFSTENAPFCLNAVVESVLDMLGFRSRQMQSELLYFVEPDVPNALVGDSGALRQILLNLMGNAIKFTERGEVELRVTRTDSPAAECLLRFTVRDTGKGILPEFSSKIFQPFEQAGNGIDESQGGSGLGLAICNSLVKNMGGSIGLDWTTERGTTFWFEIPFERPEEPASRINDDEARLFEALRVLVVEDQPAAASNYQSHLAALRMRASISASQDEAIEALTQAVKADDPYRIVLIDMALKEQQSLSLARCIKSNPSLSDIRILVLSPLDDPVPHRTQQEIGFEGQLSKPVKRSQMVRQLRLLIDADTSHDALEAPFERPLMVPRAIPVQAPVRLLVVDDHPLNREVARVMLEHLGCEVDAVESAEKALSVLQNQRYAVIFMDCELPGINGDEATRKIRQLEGELGATPVIAVTALSSEEQRISCIEAGMDDFLSKPVTEAKLAELLNRWLPVDTSLERDGVEILDPSLWAELRSAGQMQPEFVPDLVDMFFDTTLETLAKMSELLAQGDSEGLAKQVHLLKGACNQVGAGSMVALCDDLTESARDGDMQRSARVYKQLETEMQRVRPALHRMRSVE